MIIRYSTVNGGAAVLDTSTSLVSSGQDLQMRLMKRTFTAADIGGAAGQTQHAAGALVATVSGGPKIVSAILLSATDTANADKSYVAQKLTFDKATGTIRFIDGGATKLADTDIIWVLVLFGPN